MSAEAPNNPEKWSRKKAFEEGKAYKYEGDELAQRVRSHFEPLKGLIGEDQIEEAVTLFTAAQEMRSPELTPSEVMEDAQMLFSILQPKGKWWEQLGKKDKSEDQD